MRILCGLFGAAAAASHVQSSLFDFGKSIATGLCVLHGKEPIVSFPKWGDATPDQPKMALAVIHEGKLKEFELEHKSIDGAGATGDATKDLVCVQALFCTHTDAGDYMWVLDSGHSPLEPKFVQGAPKLLKVSLNDEGLSGKTERVYPIDSVEGSYLNDVRVDEKGFAYITDSNKGSITVLDLASGKTETWSDDSRMQPFIAEGDQFAIQGRDLSFFQVAVDGIAYSSVDDLLYFKPVTKRNLYRVSAGLIRENFGKGFDKVAEAVEDLGDHGFHDGLDADPEGNVYLTDLVNGAIQQRTPQGKVSHISEKGAMDWPDCVIARDHMVFVLTTQVHLLPFLNDGKDMRKKGNQLLILETEKHKGFWAKRHSEL